MTSRSIPDHDLRRALGPVRVRKPDHRLPPPKPAPLPADALAPPDADQDTAWCRFCRAFTLRRRTLVSEGPETVGLVRHVKLYDLEPCACRPVEGAP